MYRVFVVHLFRKLSLLCSGLFINGSGIAVLYTIKQIRTDLLLPLGAKCVRCYLLAAQMFDCRPLGRCLDKAEALHVQTDGGLYGQK